MNETITEFYTIAHSTPLVFVPNMGLIYFKGESKGYQVSSRFWMHIVSVMEHILERGGDFEVIDFEVITLPLPHKGMMIPLKNADGHRVSNITVWNMDWTKWWKSFVNIQRMLNYVLWKRHGPSLKLITAFKETDRAKLIPSEIMSDIIQAYYYLPPSRPICTNNGPPVRIVETNSFKIKK